MTKNRLLVVLGLLFLAYAGWWWLGPVGGPPAMLRTDGPVNLSYQSVVRGTNQLTAQQLQGRAAMLALCTNIADTGVGRDRYFCVTNTGHKAVRIYGYNTSLPFYRTEIKTNGDWTPLQTVWNSSGGVIMLRSGESLSFPAMTPNAPVYRLGVTYEEVDIPVSVTDNLMRWAERILFPKRKWDGTWFLAYSEEVRK